MRIKLLAGGLAFPLLAMAASAGAVPGGRLGVLPAGRYECALPGSAAGRAIEVQPDWGFEIIRSSSYLHREERGTYLLLGDVLTFTSGPLAGRRLIFDDNRLLRDMVDSGPEKGGLGRLRCARVPGSEF